MVPRRIGFWKPIDILRFSTPLQTYTYQYDEERVHLDTCKKDISRGYAVLDGISPEHRKLRVVMMNTFVRHHFL
jgi:hypothetical protein